MNATNGTTLTLSRRIKSTVVTGLMVLSLTVGAGAASMQASAAAPQSGQMAGQTGTTGPTFPTTGGTVAKPKGGKPKTPTAQPPVTCVHFSQDEAIIVFGEDPGPGGFTNCFFTSDLKA